MRRTRTALAVQRELARVEAAKRIARNDKDRLRLYGAEQALAWVLRLDAMAPALAFDHGAFATATKGEG